MTREHIPIEKYIEPRGCSGSCCQGRAPCDCEPEAQPGAGLVWSLCATLICVAIGAGLSELIHMIWSDK